MTAPLYAVLAIVLIIVLNFYLELDGARPLAPHGLKELSFFCNYLYRKLLLSPILNAKGNVFIQVSKRNLIPLSFFFLSFEQCISALAALNFVP